MGVDQVSLVCPKDRAHLKQESPVSLICADGHRFPVVDGVPVLLRDDVRQSISLAKASIARSLNKPGATDLRNPDLYLESLGISDLEKTLALELDRVEDNEIDPVVSVLIAATSGHSYKHLRGALKVHPIPELHLPMGHGKMLLDIGCSWGRWSLAAAAKGYRVIGVDPSLGAVMAARRVARQLGVDVRYIVADARYLPFDDASFDSVYSYSVIQHFSKADASASIAEVGRTLGPAGHCLIQMAHALGVRSLYHQCRRGFREGTDFEVRYWTLLELTQLFERAVGPTKVAAHCYGGLGLEPSDAALMTWRVAKVISLSERLRALSISMPSLRYLADSVYVSAARTPI